MHVYEFLWRGRPNGTSAYHVILEDEVKQFGETKRIESEPMTPEQAEAKGFPLSAILADINAVVMAERDSLIAERDKLTIELEQAHNEIRSLQRMVDDKR